MPCRPWSPAPQNLLSASFLVAYDGNLARRSSRLVFSSVSDPDPFGSISFWSAGSASMKQIRIRVAKNQPKSWKISTKIIRISYIFFRTIKPMFTDINIYSINNKTDHISDKYIFYRKIIFFFPIKGRICSRIRILYFTKRIRGSGSISKWNGSETLVFSDNLNAIMGDATSGGV